MLFLSLLNFPQLLLVLLSCDLIRLFTAYFHLYLWYHVDLCSSTLSFFFFAAASLCFLGLSLFLERKFVCEILLIMNLAYHKSWVVLNVCNQDFHKFFYQKLNFVQEVI